MLAGVANVGWLFTIFAYSINLVVMWLVTIKLTSQRQNLQGLAQLFNLK